MAKINAGIQMRVKTKGPGTESGTRDPEGEAEAATQQSGREPGPLNRTGLVHVQLYPSELCEFGQKVYPLSPNFLICTMRRSYVLQTVV